MSQTQRRKVREQAQPVGPDDDALARMRAGIDRRIDRRRRRIAASLTAGGMVVAVLASGGVLAYTTSRVPAAYVATCHSGTVVQDAVASSGRSKSPAVPTVPAEDAISAVNACADDWGLVTADMLVGEQSAEGGFIGGESVVPSNLLPSPVPESSAQAYDLHEAASEGPQGMSVIGVGAAAVDFQIGTGRMPQAMQPEGAVVTVVACPGQAVRTFDVYALRPGDPLPVSCTSPDRQ